MPSPPRYHSYLIRFWQVPDAEPQDWRVSLEDPRTGEKRHFPNLQAAFVFFHEALQPAPEQNAALRKGDLP